MCILICKPAGAAAPSLEVLKKCIKANPDGAGLAWASGGVLHIAKGFTTAEELAAALANVPTDAPAIIHARIATHGGVRAGLCHPFRLAGDYAATEQTGEFADGAAIAHNGVFFGQKVPDGQSETQAFIINILWPLELYGGGAVRPEFAKLIASTAGCSNKLAILTADGRFAKFGDGWIEDGGCYYSNNSYNRPAVSYIWPKRSHYRDELLEEYDDCGAGGWIYDD